MPFREQRLDLGFTAQPAPVKETPERKDNTLGQIADIITMATAPLNPALAINTFNKYSSVFHSAFRLENDVLNTIDLLTRQRVFPADPNFNVVERLKETGLWDNYRDNFIGVQGEAEFQEIFGRIQKEEHDKEVISSAGPVGILALVMAGTVSPTVLLPFIGGAKGARALALGAFWGGAGGLAQELPLQLAQETRTLAETEFSVAASTIFGGVLGGAVGYMRRSVDDIMAELDGPLSPGDTPPPISTAQSLSAASAREVAGGVKPALGLEKIIGSNTMAGNFIGSPVVQVLESGSRQGQWMAARLSDAGLVLERNAAGVASAPGGNVESRIKMYYGAVADTVRKLDEMFSRYWFEGQTPALANMRASFESTLRVRPRLTKAEFKREVAIALRNNDQHEIPEVAEVAAFARKTIFDPMLDRAEEVGLFKVLRDEETGEAVVKGDRSYLLRDYNDEVIGRYREEFVNILARHFERKLNEDFIRNLERFLKKQKKDQDLLAAMRMTPDEIEQAREAYLAELKQIDESLAEEDTALEDFLRDARSARFDKSLTEVEKKTLSEAIKELEELGGPGLKERRAKRRELRQRLSNLNKAVVSVAAKQSKKLERINRLEELQTNSIVRTVRRGQRVLRKLATMTDAQLNKELRGLRDEFERVGIQYDKAEERIHALSVEDSVEAGAKLAKAEFKQLDRTERLTALSDELAAAENADREAIRATIESELTFLAEKTAKLNARRAERAARLREQAKHLDPELAKVRLAELEKAIPERELAFRDRWRELGADDIDIGSGSASFKRYADEAADIATQRILGTNVRLPGMDVMQGLRGPELVRVLDIDSNLLKTSSGVSFLEDDVEKLIMKYVRTLAPDIEITRVFGELDPGTGRNIEFTKLNEEYRQRYQQIKDNLKAKLKREPTEKELIKATDKLNAEYKMIRRNLDGIIARLRHTWGMPKDPDGFAARAARSIMNMNVLRFMGGVTVSSIPDVARPIMKYGLLRTFRDGWLPFINNLKAVEMTKRELELSGAALDVELHTRAHQIYDIGDYMVRGSKFEKGLEWATSKMGVIALFDYWTAAMKRVAGATAIAQTLDDIRLVIDGKAPKAAIERLAARGIDGNHAVQIYTELQKVGGGERIDGIWWPNTEAWTNREARDAFRAAIVAQVDNTIITPGVERPLWTDSGVGFRMLTQFKSFALSSTTKTLMSGLQQRDAAMLMGTMVSLALGALSYYIYANLAGGKVLTEMQQAGPDRWADEAIGRSGILGSFQLMQDALASIHSIAPYVTFSGQRTTRRGGEGLAEAALGPSFDALVELGGVLADLDSPTKGTLKRFMNLLPLQNHFALRQIFDAVAEGSSLPERR